MEQMISSNTGNKNIRQPVVIIVTNGNSHSIETYIQARTDGNVREAPRAIIMVEGHRGLLLPWRDVPGPKARIDKQEILVSIVVIVQKRHPSTHGLW